MLFAAGAGVFRRAERDNLTHGQGSCSYDDDIDSGDGDDVRLFGLAMFLFPTS